MKTPKKPKLSLIIFVFLIVILIILAVQLLSLSSKYTDQSAILTKQIESTIQNNKLLEENIRLINDKSNEVRSILSLPEIDLVNSKLENLNTITEKSNEILPFYNAIDYIQSYSEKIKLENDLHNLLNTDGVREYLTKNRALLKKTGPVNYELIINTKLYLILKIDNSNISVETITESIKVFSLKNIISNNNVLFNYIDSEILQINKFYNKYNKLKISFVDLKSNNQFLQLLKTESLEISDLKTISDRLYYIIYNKDQSFSLTVSLESLHFAFSSNKFTDFNDFYNSLKQFIVESDKRTEEIKVVDSAKLRVESVLAQDSFISYLDQSNLVIILEPREDNDYFYYDILDLNQSLIGSFAVQKIIGDIYLMDPEDIMISSFKYLNASTKINDGNTSNFDIPDNLPQIIDNFSNTDSTTFVVIGSHENNADTIILVHADGITEKVTLIAIPRDLYYQENKINNYYRTYGGEKFSEVLSSITGLDIEGYIAVDMYAFIDLINILGGIDITLEADLIDPTYMVRDNGEWSTLYYTKGSHHLNGIESLRITRSRHTSSDFGRTSRQQLVIKGIKDKMSSLDITDLGTILELFRTMEKYLDTNFSSMEMLSLFIKYKDSNLNRKQGLSTFNVLYNTYTNIYNLKDKSIQYEEGFYRGYWILLPQKNDWNVIKWYIRSLIEEN